MPIVAAANARGGVQLKSWEQNWPLAQPYTYTPAVRNRHYILDLLARYLEASYCAR